ncbi:hypothetical protein [Propionivibrio sp.]
MKLMDSRHSGEGRNPVVRYWIPGQARNDGIIYARSNLTDY